MIDAIDRELIRRKVRRKARELCEEKYPALTRDVGRVQIVESTRPTTNSGRAVAGKKIVLALRLLDNESQYEQTLAHEMAHIICFWAHGKQVHHGPAWKQMMHDLGYPPDRCHHIDVAEKMPGRYKRIDCECGATHYLGPVRQKRIRTGTTYVCRCGRAISLDG